MVNGFRTKPIKTKAQKRLAENNSQWRVIMAVVAETTTAYFQRPLPKDLLDLVMSDVDGHIQQHKQLSQQDLAAIVLRNVTDYKAAEAELQKTPETDTIDESHTTGA